MGQLIHLETEGSQMPLKASTKNHCNKCMQNLWRKAVLYLAGWIYWFCSISPQWFSCSSPYYIYTSLSNNKLDYFQLHCRFCSFVFLRSEFLISLKINLKRIKRLERVLLTRDAASLTVCENKTLEVFFNIKAKHSHRKKS